MGDSAPATLCRPVPPSLAVTPPGVLRLSTSPSRQEGQPSRQERQTTAQAGAAPPLDDARVEAAKRGDPSAWESAYLVYGRALMGYLMMRLENRDDAAEALSETFARAIDKASSFRGDAYAFRAWLFSIARNVSTDQHRFRARLVVIPEIPETDDRPQPSGDDLAILAEDVAEIRRGFARLPQADQEVLWLRVCSGLSAADVGKVLGKKAGAVRMQQLRALELAPRADDAMTAEFPDRDERARAEALDAALDREPQAQRRAGPRAPTDDLADLAAGLRAAMPMPELPSGGRTEVRAAALAVRGAKRRDRTRLLAAAAVTLVIGVVGGAALSSAVQQQGPTSNQAQVQVDLDYASGYLAKHDSAKASQYIERASKAMLGKAPAPLAADASTAGETAAIAALRQELAVQMERDTKLEAQNAKLSQDLGSMTRTAQADVPGPATGSTSSTTTPRRTAITAPTTTARQAYAAHHDGTQVCAARLRRRHPGILRPPRRHPPRRHPPRRHPPRRHPRPPRQAQKCRSRRCRSRRRSPRRAPEGSGLRSPWPSPPRPPRRGRLTTTPRRPRAPSRRPRPKTTTTTSGAAPSSTTTSSTTTTTLSTTTTTVPTTTTTVLPGTTTTSVATSTTTTSS